MDPFRRAGADPGDCVSHKKTASFSSSHRGTFAAPHTYVPAASTPSARSGHVIRALRPRGATYVEYSAVLAILVAVVLGGILVFGAAMRRGTGCEGKRIAATASGGAGDCSGAPAIDQALATGPQLPGQTPTRGMICDRLGCRGEGNCFAGGTAVAIPGGAHRAIETLVPGDMVLALDPDTGESGPRRVLATKRTEDRALVAVDTMSPWSRDRIRVTPEHPFFVAGKGWTAAGALDPDDRIVSSHGIVTVASVAELAEIATVYNLEVEDLHTYFVGGGDALVHNDCADEPRKTIPIDEPRLRVAPPDAKGNFGGFMLQRRAMVNGEKIIGEPTKSVVDIQDASREARGAEVMAKRPDVAKVYLGADAETYLRQLASARGTPFPEGAKMPDIVGVKQDGSLLLGEGKGVSNVGKAQAQFESVGKHVGSAKIAEQWVFPQGEPQEFRVGKGGYLEELVKQTDKGEAKPKADLDKMRKAGVMVETRPRADGGTDYVKPWKPNGVKVQIAILEELPPNPARGPATPATPAPVIKAPIASEPVAPKPAVGVAPKPAVAVAVAPTEVPGVKPATAPASPSLGSQIKGQAFGGGIAITGTVAGKIVEHETGSPTAGLATNVAITGGGTVVVAKVAGQGVLRTVGGATGASLAGMAARHGTEYVTGSKTAGDLAGFGAAAGTGAAFGGPVGAIGGVVVHGASELASNGMDYYYAKREGEEREERRKILIIHVAFARALARAPSDRELAVFKRMMDKGWNQDMVILMAASNADAPILIKKIYQLHLGRPPTPLELGTAQQQLTKGAWLSAIEERIMVTKISYAYILARAPDESGLATWTDFLAKGGSVEAMRAQIADSAEAKQLVVKIYKAHLGRPPTQAEADAARVLLEKGTSAHDLEILVEKSAPRPAK